MWISILTVILLTIISCKNDPEIIIKSNFSIELNDTLISLAVGGQQKMIYNINPVNAKWTSSDTTIAKVSNLGIIKGISAGDATISVTGNNNFSGKCKVKVTDTPVSELIMPDVNYPINNGSTFILQGKGFKEGDKIWLRKHVTNSSVKKVKGANSEINTSEESDYLATIHEIAANYITISANVPDGWYQLILEEVNKAYNLGNLQLNTVELPEYTYDKSKIFWDDTHWRRFQLRGKVKSMTTIDSYYPFWTDKNYYTFNANGYFESFALINSKTGEHYGQTNYKYDEKNRLVKKTHYSSNGTTIDLMCDYSYGNHSMYVPIDYHYERFLPEGYKYFYSSIPDVSYQNRYILEMWSKGLAGIKLTEGSKVTNYQFSISTDSIIISIPFSAGLYRFQIEKYYYQGNYPFKSIENLESSSDGAQFNMGTYSYTCNSTGMLTQQVFVRNLDKNTCEMEKDCPFCVYKTYDDFWGDPIGFTYDKNWNLSTVSDNYSLTTFYYTSFDVYGNWTACTALSKDKNNQIHISLLNREFTYW